MENGFYRTAAGSKVILSGKHGSKAVCAFDWLEEPNSCCDCVVNPYPEQDGDKMLLTWQCDVCGGGMTELARVEGAIV